MAGTDWREKAPMLGPKAQGWRGLGGGEGLRLRGAFIENRSHYVACNKKTTRAMKIPRMGDPVGSGNRPDWPNVLGLRPHCCDSCVYWERKVCPAMKVRGTLTLDALVASF